MRLYNRHYQWQIFGSKKTSSLVNWIFLTASYTDSTKSRNSLWFDEEFDISFPYISACICIWHYRLYPLFWGSCSELSYPDTSASTNLHKDVVIYFGSTGLRWWVWYLVNIVNAWISQENCFTGLNTMVGDIFDTWYSYVYGFFYAAFNSDSSSNHPS